MELFRQREEADAMTGDTGVKLPSAAFAALSGHLAGKRVPDRSLDTEAITPEAQRPFLRVPVRPAMSGTRPRRPAPRSAPARRDG